jgi:hypothetical protein
MVGEPILRPLLLATVGCVSFVHSRDSEREVFYLLRLGRALHGPRTLPSWRCDSAARVDSEIGRGGGRKESERGGWVGVGGGAKQFVPAVPLYARQPKSMPEIGPNRYGVTASPTPWRCPRTLTILTRAAKQDHGIHLSNSSCFSE